MERGWRWYDGMLNRMAESMGLMIVAVPANSIVGETWHVAKRCGDYVLRLTVSYFSPKELFDKFLRHYDVFNTGSGTVRNPFYGMSPEEAELRLAVMGA